MTSVTDKRASSAGTLTTRAGNAHWKPENEEYCRFHLPT